MWVQPLGLDPKIFGTLFALSLGVENEGVHQFQNVLFAADIRQGIVFHGFFEIDEVQAFDTILPALQQGADLL